MHGGLFFREKGGLGRGGRWAGGGGRGHLGFLALDLTALLALWAAGGLAAPADFHRTHKKSHWSLKALKIFLVSLVYVFLWTLALRSSSCSCCLCPTAAGRWVRVWAIPTARPGSFLNSFFSLLTPRHPTESTDNFLPPNLEWNRTSMRYRQGGLSILHS